MRWAERALLAAAVCLVGVGAVAGASVAEDGAVRAEVAFTFIDPAITESSGLVAGDLFVTVNDSGDDARIFTVDPATGDTVGTTTWDGEAVDVESLAPAGPGEVWVGDTGDNLAQRSSVTITRVPYGTGDRAVAGETFELTYPDRAHDAETLLVHPETGQVFVVVKEFIGRVYAAPRRLDPDGPNRLREVGSALGISTDGAFWPDGNHVVLRNYGQAAVYTWPELRRLDTLTLPTQEQGEGIAVSPEGSVYVSSEGEASDVLRIDMPAALRAELDAEPAAEPAEEETTEPSGADDADADAESGDGVDLGFGVDLWMVWIAVAVVGGVVLLRALRPR